MVKRQSLSLLKSVSRIFLRILRNFKYVPYEGYVMKRSKHMPTHRYFYLASQIENFMMSNLRGSVKTEIVRKEYVNTTVCSTD